MNTSASYLAAAVLISSWLTILLTGVVLGGGVHLLLAAGVVLLIKARLAH